MTRSGNLPRDLEWTVEAADGEVGTASGRSGGAEPQGASSVVTAGAVTGPGGGGPGRAVDDQRGAGGDGHPDGVDGNAGEHELNPPVGEEGSGGAHADDGGEVGKMVGAAGHHTHGRGARPGAGGGPAVRARWRWRSSTRSATWMPNPAMMATR